jgi:hypothetical protein
VTYIVEVLSQNLLRRLSKTKKSHSQDTLQAENLIRIISSMKQKSQPAIIDFTVTSKTRLMLIILLQ